MGSAYGTMNTLPCMSEEIDVLLGPVGGVAFGDSIAVVDDGHEDGF